MHKSILSTTLFSLLLLSGACASELQGSDPVTDTDPGNGGGSGSGGGNGDDTGNGDGMGGGNGDGTGDGPGDGPGDDPGGTATVCLANSEITTTAAGTEGFVGYQEGTTGPQMIDVYVPLTEGDGDHFLNLSLWDGYGVFSGGLNPGTYQLAGDELDLANCGACVLVASEATESEALLASGGTVTISAVSTTVGSQFTASVSNLSFKQFRVDAASEMISEVPGGCQANLASAEISATIEVMTP